MKAQSGKGAYRHVRLNKFNVKEGHADVGVTKGIIGIETMGRIEAREPVPVLGKGWRQKSMTFR